MAKLSQIKLGSTTYDIGAAWGNISGKPTEFPPSSHTHSYLPLSGGTLTGTVNSSGNMNLYGSNAYFSLGTSSSSNKCYFQTYNATTPGADDANLKAGFGFGWSNSLIIDKSGNVTIPGDLIVSGGDITGNAATATKLTTDAGNTTTPVYFSGGVPKACTLIKSGAWHGGLTYIGSDGVMEVGRYIDFHVDKTGTSDYDVRITASTTGLSIGGTTSGTFKGNLDGNASSATKATQDGSGNVITSKYVTLDTAQTISGTKTMTSSLKVSGRYVGSGDDEGIIVGFAPNGYAGLTLGGPSEARSVFYFKSDGSSPFWRYNNGSASYDILHPSKSGTIALTSDLGGYAKLASPNNLIHSGNEFTFASDAFSGDLYINYRTANNSQNGNITTYRFCKGAGGTLSNIAADTFIGKLNGKADSAGYADSAGTCTSLSTNAGSATKAIYFSGGKPVQCNDTINHNISGTAANSNILNINNSANLSSCLQYIQVSAQTSGNDLPSNNWWHVIKMNHGQGDTYYKRLLAFDFWNDNIMTSGAAGDGKTRAWKQVWVEGNSVTGAVWNDYAECRESDYEEPGRVLIENGNDTLSLATERLQQFAGISSDTWGFSQGKTEKAKTHIAVAGRVLAYPYQNRDNYKPGDCVCAAPGGTVDIMTREEVINWPDRIVGTVSCVPDYEEWGGGEKADRDPVKVNGRIWIKVR